MDPARFALLKKILLRASELPPQQRERFLEDQCGEDLELGDLVRSLILQKTESLELSDLSDLESLLPDIPAAQRPAGVPDRIGPYRILDTLGVGGMGTVYHAVQEEPFRREVAVKVIRQRVDSARFLERVEQERHALSLMEHPNITRMLDVGQTEEGDPYIVMELVRGMPITNYCREGNLDLPARLKLFESVCRAVQHAHQKGVIHRDLKPSNIIVTEGDKGPIPKIIDFGIAKIVQSDEAFTALTLEGQLIGTPMYMSPEQARGRHNQLDTRSDIYALGVILFELISDHLPYDLRSHSPLEVMRVIDQESPRTLRMTGTIGGPVHEDLEIIVQKAMEKEPDGRFSSAGDLADDLGRFLCSEPIGARPPNTIYLLRKLIARNRLSFGLAAFFLSGLIVLTILLAVQLQTTQRERNIAEYQARRASQFNTVFGRAMTVAENPGGDVSDLLFRDVLDAVAEASDSEQHTDPDVQANILFTLGWMYRTIELHEEAETQLGRSIEIAQRHGASTAPDLGLALSELSWVKLVKEERDVAAADSLISLAIDIMETGLGESNSDLAVALDRLVRIRLVQGRPAEAESLATRVISIRESLYDDDHMVLAGAYQMLAWASFSNGKPAKSVANLRHALEIFDQGYPGDNSFKSYLMGLLCVQLGERGHISEAESLGVAGVEMARRMHGDSHDHTAWMLRHLAEVRLAGGRYSQAEACYLEALDILAGLESDVGHEPALCRTGLGRCYLKLGDWDRAREHLTKAAAAWKEAGDSEMNSTLLEELNQALADTVDR